MARALAELLDAVLPTTCICCGTLGPHICESCRSGFAVQNRAVTRAGLSGIAVLDLDPPVHQLLRAIKDQGRTAALSELAVPIADAIVDNYVRPKPALAESVLVAMPTTRLSLRHRGCDLNQMLLRRVARRTGLQSNRGLRFARQPADQRGLDQAARFENLSGTMVFHPPPRLAPIILVDDVLTTGSTLLEADRAIREAGGEVAGFCVFAETRLLQDAKKEK